jgi:SAM-dependent methyltransferase
VIRDTARSLLRRLPGSWRRRIGWLRSGAPTPGKVDLGDLRRLTPLSREFGYDRGLPVDRYYIETFLAASADFVRGRVLEIGDRDYTERFGGSRVTRSDVLNINPGKAVTTIVADLADGEGIPSDAFDCVILTQTLHLLYDLPSAIATLRRILRPGGTLLLTVPGTISQIATDEWAATWFWGFTGLSLRRLLEEAFPAGSIELAQHGNVLASIGFLEGMAAGEFSAAELDHRDELYPLVITARVTRPL